MTRTTRSSLLLTTLAIAAVRFLIEPRLDLPTATGSYEAVAHLFVGGLFGAWLVNRQRPLLLMAVSVSLLELIMFLVQKGR